MTTRSKAGVFKPKRVIVSATASIFQKPSLVATALIDSNWKQDMLINSVP